MTDRQNEDDPPKVVINHAMIERFRVAEFDSSAFTFQDLMKTYSLDEVRLLVQSYSNSEFIFTDKAGMDQKLAEMESEMEHKQPFESISPVKLEEIAIK